MVAKGKNFITIKQAAELLGRSERHICRLCGEGVIAGAVKIKHKWQIPQDSHPRFCSLGTSEEYAEQLKGLPADKWDGIVKKLKVIRAFEQFANAYTRYAQKGNNLTAAKVKFAKKCGIGLRTLERWLANHNQQGASGLWDRRGGNFTKKNKASFLPPVLKSVIEGLNTYISPVRAMCGAYVGNSIPGRNFGFD